ncbi:MAG: c-type cytochrome [Mariniblastus sp.]|nr:c-type cytochrome [Mariniblastus sp.]
MTSFSVTVAEANVPSGRLGPCVVQDPQEDEETVAPPKVFLDRSPRIVAYQLKRLSNERLLAVPRSTDDAKYLPVFQAILMRDGMPVQERADALQAVVVLNESDPVSEIIQLLEALPTESRQEKATAQSLAAMLLDQPDESLIQNQKALEKAIAGTKPMLRVMGHAALMESGLGGAPPAGSSGMVDWLKAISMVPSLDVRNKNRPGVNAALDSADPDVRRAAILALGEIASQPDETFLSVAKLVEQPEMVQAAVQTLLSVPVKERDSETSRALVEKLVTIAEETPTEKRTTDPFFDAMQLIDQLLVAVSVDEARQYRKRLDQVSVRLVRIGTVEDEMRYDVSFFAVEAGRPVQVVLDNTDLMAHNFLIVQPGTLKEVAVAGLAVGPKQGYQGKPYVPESADVLFASGLIPAFQQEILTFTAPTEPGEYPFVCTFPQHWSRMYGVMVVVEDLEAWQQNPVTPKDPIGSNRTFVKEWKVGDFSEGLERGLQGRSMKIGERIFKEATCAQCHQLGGSGGAVGPALDDVFERYQGDSLAVLREILEPSNRIDEKYAMHMILTVDGLTITGIIQEQDKNQVVLLDNPESDEPTTVLMEEVEEMVKTSKSIMPKALMNQFTKDEILEMLAYLRTSQRPSETTEK